MRLITSEERRKDNASLVKGKREKVRREGGLSLSPPLLWGREQTSEPFFLPSGEIFLLGSFPFSLPGPDRNTLLFYSSLVLLAASPSPPSPLWTPLKKRGG